MGEEGREGAGVMLNRSRVGSIRAKYMHMPVARPIKRPRQSLKNLKSLGEKRLYMRSLFSNRAEAASGTRASSAFPIVALMVDDNDLNSSESWGVLRIVRCISNADARGEMIAWTRPMYCEVTDSGKMNIAHSNDIAE